MKRVPDSETLARKRHLETLLSKRHSANVTVGGWSSDEEMRLAEDIAHEIEALFGLEIANLNRYNAASLIEQRRRYKESLKREALCDFGKSLCEKAAIAGFAVLVYFFFVATFA